MHHRRTDLTITIPPSGGTDYSWPKTKSAQDNPLPLSPFDDWHEDDSDIITTVHSTIPSTIYLADLTGSTAPTISRDTTAAIAHVGRIDCYWSDASSYPEDSGSSSLSEDAPPLILPYHHTYIRSPLGPATPPIRSPSELTVLHHLSRHRAGFNSGVRLPDPLLTPAFTLKDTRSTFNYLARALLLGMAVATSFCMSLLVSSGVYFSGDSDRSSKSITEATTDNEEVGEGPIPENASEPSGEEKNDWEDVGSLWEFESDHDDDWSTTYSDSVGNWDPDADLEVYQGSVTSKDSDDDSYGRGRSRFRGIP